MATTDLGESKENVLDIAPKEYNELQFKVAIEGIATKPERINLVVEDSDLSYMFNGTYANGVCKIVVPPMSNSLLEGKLYKGKIMMVLSGQYFEPYEVYLKMKQTAKIHVEVANKPSVVVSEKPTQKVMIEKKQPEPVVTKEEEEDINFDSIIAEKVALPTKQPIKASQTTQTTVDRKNEGINFKAQFEKRMQSLKQKAQ